MKLRLIPVLGVLASMVLCNDASFAAEPVRWPALAHPPAPWQNVELGVRYWNSQGQDKYSIDSSGAVPAYGSPTSVLDYDDVDAQTVEFTYRIENPTGWFFKGFIGAGLVDDGTFDDEDYFSGQVKFSDTLSAIDGDSMFYFTLDIGRRFSVTTQRGRYSIAPLVGFNFWREDVSARGAMCNADDLGGVFCGVPGQVVVPFSTTVITNEQDWSSLRLGAEARATFFDRLTLTADVAWLPVALLDDDDSHHLRTDLGKVPNIRNRGTGYGVQVEASARYRVTNNIAVGGGVRYWYAETDGDTDFTRVHTSVMLKKYESERFGAFADLLYMFSWY